MNTTHSQTDNPSNPPTHIGYILDGNRRWAKKHGLPTYEGHLAGYNSLRDVIEATADRGVKYISFYTFSTENWNRSEEEVRGLMRIIRRMFKTDVKKLIEKDFRLVVLGSREGLPADIATMIDEAEEESKNGQRAVLAMCFNYGGQQEIVAATKAAIRDGADPEHLDVEGFVKYLDHPDVPPCDLIVRTSGEQRLSNFMLWRSAYSELLFIDKLWPDMTPADVDDILKEYSTRKRRYGV